jgi:hypothetical protein
MSLVAPAAENIADYAYRTGIETAGTATWRRAEIPASVQWQAAHADLRDLRIFDARGETLPFALSQRETRHTREWHEAAARLFPLHAGEASGASQVDLARDGGLRVRRGSDGAVEIEITDAQTMDARQPGQAAAPRKLLRGWLLDAGSLDFVPERLSLDWAGEEEGFFRFTLAGSDDLEHWRDWGNGQIVRLRFDGQSITQREIRLPRRKVRYLRLLWQDAGAGRAVDLRGARLMGVAGVSSALAPFAWSPPLAGEPLPDRPGEFIWYFPSSLPLARVSIAMDEVNTLAPVLFSGRGDPLRPAAARPRGKPLVAEILRGERRVRDVFRSRPREQAQRRGEKNAWRPLASGVVYRLSADTGEQVDEELGLPGIPVRQLRMQVDPRGGGLGAKEPVIKVALHARDLVFLARGDAPYQLAAGRAEAQAADLPLSTLIPMGIEQAEASGRLGRARIVESPMTNSSTSVPPASLEGAATPEDGGSDARKAMLWGILFIGAALLAGMAFNLLRTAKKGDDPGKT